MKKRIIGICILLVCLILTFAACDSSYDEPYDEPYDDADNNTNHPDVQYISNRSINRDDENNQFYFLFAFKDSNENYIKSEATVEIRIVNDADETVYSATRNVKESDFGQWHNAYEEWMGASIYIKDSEISKGSSEYGTFYYKITAADGTWFNEYSLRIYEGLPVNTLSDDDDWIEEDTEGWETEAVDTEASDSTEFETEENDEVQNAVKSVGETWVVDGVFEFTVDKVFEHELCNSYADNDDTPN